MDSDIIILTVGSFVTMIFMFNFWRLKMSKKNPCFTCSECCSYTCPNVMYDIAGDFADDYGYKKIKCKDCSYNTGKCEDCLFYDSSACERKEK